MHDITVIVHQFC